MIDDGTMKILAGRLGCLKADCDEICSYSRFARTFLLRNLGDRLRTMANDIDKLLDYNYSERGKQ